MEAASMVASTREFVGSLSSKVSVPFTPVNCPFTLEIIMCFTLNSATEWTGSMFQVLTVVCGAASVLMVGFPFAFVFDVLSRYSLQQIMLPKNQTTWVRQAESSWA